MKGPSITGIALGVAVVLALIWGAIFFVGRDPVRRSDAGTVSAVSATMGTGAPRRPRPQRPLADGGLAPPPMGSAAPAGEGDLVVGTLSPRGYMELPLIAKTKGFFDAEGLRVQIARKKTAGEVVREVAEGKLGLGLSLDLTIAFDAFRAPSIVVVASLAHTRRPMTLYARKDRGITTVSDLKGKRIGVETFVSSHYFLNLFLKRHRMSEADVTVVEMKHQQLLGALTRGDVDGIADGFASMHTPAWNPKNMPGLDVTDLSEADACPVQVCLLASRELVRKDPQAIEKFTRAMVNAVDFMNTLRDDAVGLIAQTLTVDAGRVRELSEGMTFEASLGPSLLSALDDEGRWFQSTGVPRSDGGVPSYASFIYPDALRRVLPAAVTLPP
jgi:ABC-type nitrate/sulfonate/bicarbonate transport system substrate-binding protein